MGGPGSGAKPKQFPADLVAAVGHLYLEHRMSQDEVAAALGLTQKIVWNLMRRHGIESRPTVKRSQWGEANAYWKGDEAGYQGFHVRVVAERGKPQRCSACDAEGPDRYEWANLTGRYEDPADYIRLCISCHRRYNAERGRLTGERTSPRRGGDAQCSA